MPGLLLYSTATILCPHAASVMITTSNTRVTASGQPLVTMNDTYTVSGCPFQVPVGAGTKPQPCVRVQWTVPATRVFVNKQPVLLQSSTGICFSAESIPQGPPNVVVTQPRVKGI